VVASDVGGCSELIIEQESGYLVPIRDAEVMAQSMIEYVDDKQKIVDHGLAAYELYQHKYSLPVMLNSYAEEYGILNIKQRG